MTMRQFARNVGFKSANVAGFKNSLRVLEEAGALKVKQGGFVAHSMCHPKIVYIRDWQKVISHFGQVKRPAEKQLEHYYDEEDKSEETIICALSFCVSSKICKHQVERLDLPYPLCLELKNCKQQMGTCLTKKRVETLLKEIYSPDERSLFFNC
jgi:hypothetical protein